MSEKGSRTGTPKGSVKGSTKGSKAGTPRSSKASTPKGSKAPTPLPSADTGGAANGTTDEEPGTLMGGSGESLKP